MCKSEVIASQGMTKIERCDHCGCIHLHLGPFSVRLESHTARDLFRTIARVLPALEEETKAAPVLEEPRPLKLN